MDTELIHLTHQLNNLPTAIKNTIKLAKYASQLISYLYYII